MNEPLKETPAARAGANREIGFQNSNNSQFTDFSCEINRNLGCIPGAGLPLAKSHRNQALRKWQTSPTISNWRKLNQACQRLRHVYALKSRIGGAA